MLPLLPLWYQPCPRRSLVAVGGLEHLRAWLRAELFLTNFRPVPLSEHAIFRGKVYEKIGPQASLGELAAGTRAGMA